jgi:hypothetical protein
VTRAGRAGRRIELGAAPLLALAAAGGLVAVAFANNAARDQLDHAQQLFWGGLLVIYAPIALRLLSISPSRAERIALSLVLGLSLFVVSVLASPDRFARFDELGTLRATEDILRSGSFFAENPIVVSTEGFPGLEAVTAALASLSGLSVFHAGLIVIGLARAALMLAVFLFLERLAGSARAAGIGILVYACNPSFVYFDAQFAYESLALAIAAALLLLTLRWSDLGEDDPAERRLALGILALVATLTVTHHMTSFAILGFLTLWTGLIAYTDPSWPRVPPRQALARLRRTRWAKAEPWLSGPGFGAALLAIAIAIWFTFVAGEVTYEELGSVFTGMVDSVINLFFGGSGPKALFEGGGEANGLLLRTLAFASVIPLLALLPPGVWRAWRGADSTPLRKALAVVALAYPVTLGLRLTLAGSETSQRASEFAFLGVAFLAAIVLGGFRRSGDGFLGGAKTALVACLATICFIGGFVIGELPATRQPGPFEVGADSRSISAEGLDAARFAADSLPPRSRVIVDRSNAILLGSYGGLDPVFGQTSGGIGVPRVLFSERYGPADVTVLREQDVDYVVVDRRLSRDLPAIGYYVESDEPQAYTREVPLPRARLEKFEDAAGLEPIYDNGPITIYEASEAF